MNLPYLSALTWLLITQTVPVETASPAVKPPMEVKAAFLKLLLAPAQLFQFALLFLDLLRLPLQLQKLLLRFLHLGIEMLRRHRLFFA